MKKYSKHIFVIALIGVLGIGYIIVDTILFNGIKPSLIHDFGFQANYFVKDNMQNKTTIVLIGGGQWGDYWAQEFARKEMVGISLPYSNREGLPKLPEEIDLEYFENAIKWLRKQKEVDPTKIVLMGASRNAELALVVAATFPEIVDGVVAYAPSSVSWSNTVLPYNSDEIKASWTYNGNDIPYIPMEKISGNDTDKIKMIDYWKNGLSKTGLANNAMIKVEHINGPILLFSGIDDMVWPSSMMADMIAKRLKDNNFTHSFENVKYENAGHLISNNPDERSNFRTGTIRIDGKNYEYEFGGTSDGDNKAKNASKQKLMEFLSKI